MRAALTKKLSSFLLLDLTLTVSFSHGILALLFFCSGASALMYQVMWQRMLFTVFGVDLASITIIVSVFMFGLGLGGLLGGYLADIAHRQRLMLYVAIEFGIAAFGFLSPSLIDWLGNVLFNNSVWLTGLSSFLILAFPTVLMGATFPLLVTEVNTLNQHTGRSVGSLYFANTLGAALGAYFSGFVLLYTLDVVGVINCAACLNLAIALAALLIFRRRH